MNRLANESSPYLRAHKDNPVDWYPWGPEALAAAAAQNKPIFLSIGYSACLWCTVMTEETFSDPEVASLLNENFINILVDREERPDVDQCYQAAANLMGHGGGWPLSAFLTPQKIPFIVGTYFPQEERTGQAPPFRTIIDNVLRARRDEPAQIATVAEALMTQLTNLWHRDMRGPVGPDMLDSAAVRIGQRFDLFFGGLTAQLPKFPSAPHVDVLLRAFLRTGMPQFLQLGAQTLDAVLLGGLWDHVGGGFFRYAQDERWIVPQFEKTLVDNALLLDLTTSFWQHNRNKLCGERIPETVEFLLRDMRSGPAFVTSIQADVDGLNQGNYYLWTEPEIDAALMGTFAVKFKTAYGVTRDGNYNGKTVLQRLKSPAPYPQSDADEALFAKQRELLLKARRQRPAPSRDEKILADQNGLAIAAIAYAGGTFQNTAWIQAAIEAFEYVVKALGDGDRLYHSWIAGTRGAPGFADDYANMARAAIALYEVAGDKRYLEIAKRWTRVLNEHFWDNDRGGYCYTADDADTMIVRSRMVFDQPAPSANATMLKVLTCLMMATADTAYGDRLNALAGAFAGEAQRVFASMPSYFAGLEFAMSGLQLVVIGPPTSAKTHELTDAILGLALPNRFLTVMAPGEAFPSNHSMFGRQMQNGLPTAYICQRGQVSSPVINAVTLTQMLQLPVQRQQPGARPQ
ncbi:MAG: thioredoxin domain-containing protein [Rhizomicrobium sp.]